MCQVRNVGMVAVLTCILVLHGSNSEARDALEFTNDTSQVMELWIWPYIRNEWKRPPKRFAPGESRIVYFKSNEEVYLLFRDAQLRETPIGRVNVSNVLANYPNYKVAIQRVTKTAFRESYYRCPRCGCWHRIAEPPRFVYIFSWLDGQTGEPLPPIRALDPSPVKEPANAEER